MERDEGDKIKQPLNYATGDDKNRVPKRLLWLEVLIVVIVIVVLVIFVYGFRP